MDERKSYMFTTASWILKKGENSIMDKLLRGLLYFEYF